MKPHDSRPAPRRRITVMMDESLVARARAEKLNIALIAEGAILRALARSSEKNFHEEIARSVASYHDYLAEYGSFSDAVRAMDDDEAA